VSAELVKPKAMAAGTQIMSSFVRLPLLAAAGFLFFSEKRSSALSFFFTAFGAGVSPRSCVGRFAVGRGFSEGGAIGSGRTGSAEG
jgi:hypothetical protein